MATEAVVVDVVDTLGWRNELIYQGKNKRRYAVML